jgi:phospholipase/carboxylesterase|tara:strand:- start:4036 stop:4680 length:645 start_codon:yes stop_codon:yes gene_type:complete
LIINYYQDSNSPKRAVIGLHGWTGDEHAMVPVAKSMGLNDTKWYMPRAPYKADVGKGFTWFSGNDETGWEYEKTFELTTALISQVLEDGFAPKDIYLIGFSMGAGLCLHVTLRLDFAIGGIIPIAGFIRNPDRLFNDATDISRQTPILILHGTEDDIITVDKGQKAHDLLNEHGYSVRMETYKAHHKIPLLAGAIIKDFIKDNELYLSVKMESK